MHCVIYRHQPVHQFLVLSRFVGDGTARLSLSLVHRLNQNDFSQKYSIPCPGMTLASRDRLLRSSNRRVPVRSQAATDAPFGFLFVCHGWILHLHVRRVWGCAWAVCDRHAHADLNVVSLSTSDRKRDGLLAFPGRLGNSRRDRHPIGFFRVQRGRESYFHLDGRLARE
jgi:hypothetical protein